MVDRAFETLLISIALHALVYWGYDKFPVPPPTPAPTEVTLIEKPAPQHAPVKERHVITETQEKQREREPDIKKQADFLSQFTNRVKKQVQAEMLGDTVNAANRRASEARKAQHAAGQDKPRDKGELNFEKKKREQELTAPMAGESSVQEIIPGVESANMTVLNTDAYLYYAFYHRTYEQVRNRWVPGIRGYVEVMTPKMQEQLAARNRTTIIEIMLTPEGQLFRTIVQESSGDKGLDEVALDAIKKAMPFNHPPAEMVKADGFIHYYASFTVLFRPPGFGPAG